MNSDLRVILATLWLFALASIAACGSGTEVAPRAPADGASATSEADAAVAPSGPALPAPAVTQAAWTPDALEELLAPIALYPDQLLGQILAASVNAQEVLDAGNWLLENQNLTGDALDTAAQQAGFGPATRALVQFPTVVDMMCQQIDWTRQLGAAFTSDQQSVLDAVQRLRTQAAQVGNLKSTPQQVVETKQEDDKVVVEVQPADPKVVYVPQYDPQAVYTMPPPAPAADTNSDKDTVGTGAAVAGGLLAFGVGVVLGHAMDDDDDYYYPHWGAGAVYFGSRPFYPPAYVYRPVYGPAFHPAYRYTPPPGYRHSYNRVNVDVNRNIVVNNDNYFNRFDNDRNLHVDATARSGAIRPQSRSSLDRAQDWRGRSTYAGTRRDATRTDPATRGPEENRQPRPQQREVNPARPAEDHVARREREIKQTPSQTPSRELDIDRARERVRQPEDAAPRDHAFAGANTPALERAASARGNASAGMHRERIAHAGRRR